MLRVGLIGCGGMGAVHAKVYEALSDRVKLIAVADFNTERAEELTKACGAKVYKDAHEMLAKETLDLVDICLPTALHAEYVMAALDHVKDVLCEKPLCLFEEEADDLLAKARQTGGKVHVAHVARFCTEYMYLKDVCTDGRYGKLLTADFYRLSPKPVWVKDYDNPKKTGGMPLDLHIHDVDYIRYLMGGDPDSLTSTVNYAQNGNARWIWSSYFYGDAVVTAESSWDLPASMPFTKGFRVHFERATLVLAGGMLTVYPEDGESFVPALEKRITMDLGINVNGFGTYLYEITAFIDAITEGKESPVPLSEAADAIRLVRKELALAEMKK